jgi:3',5'-cyclic AMP phosphodiesterase CpdA
VRFPFLRRRGPLALIGLSSAVPTPPFMATGRLGSEQITGLGKLLCSCGRERLFRIVLMHHPPISRRSRYFKRLVDARDFCSTVAQFGAELVLHGHDHVHSLDYIAGPNGRIPVVGVPSASEASSGRHERAAYNLYGIELRRDVWRCDARARGFPRDGGETIVEISRSLLAGD